MITLRLTLPDGTTTEQVFEQDSIVIGRSSHADLQVTDRAMSRRHARLFLADQSWLVEDLGSHNGTSLDGCVVTMPQQLLPGSELELGETVITVAPPPSAAGSGIGHAVFRPAAELVLDSDARELASVGGEEVQRYVDQLRLLNEVHQALATTITLEELLDLILDRIFSHFSPEEAAVFLARGTDGAHCAASRSTGDNDSVPGLHSARLLEEVMGRGQAALVMDAELDGRFSHSESLIHSGIRSLVAAPMPAPEGAIGMIVMASRLTVRQFQEADMQLLASLAGVAALYIRNLRLAEEAAERQRLEGEIALAREIQLSLLPATLPLIPRYQLRAGNIPSRGASGDFYKLVSRAPDDELILMLADVSGKGIAAALLTASIEALSAPLIHGGVDPASLCRELSQLVYERTSQEKYATCVIVRLDPREHRLVIANAGHNPGLLLQPDGSVEWLGATGIPLGILPHSSYQQRELRMDVGDTLLLYTDGITEAMNPAELEYGAGRLLAVASRHRSAPLAELAEAIEADLDDFVAGRPFEDDRTVVMVRRVD